MKNLTYVKRFSTMHTFPAHAHFKTFFEPAKLTLVSMMLINWTITIPSTGIRKISSDTSFEKTFTS